MFFDGASILCNIDILGKNVTVAEDTFAGLDMSKVTFTIAEGSSLKDLCDKNKWNYIENKEITDEDIVVEDINATFTNMGLIDAATLADTSHDGKLDKYEIAEVKSLTLYSPGDDLTGIKYFTSLESLDMSKNSYIKRVDLEGMTSLKTVNFTSASNLVELNLSGCSGLTSVTCSKTLVSSLDLSAATGLTSLTANGCGLACLDLSNNTKLTKDAVNLEDNIFIIPAGKEINISSIPGFDKDKASKLDAIEIDEGKIRVDGSSYIIDSRGVKMASYSGGSYEYDMGNGVKATFKIGLADYPSPRDLELYVSNVTVDNEIYTGEPCEPEPTIVLSNIYKDNVTELDKDCYTVSYKNNTDPGTATIVLTGKYKYYGTKEGTFKIIDEKVVMPYDSKNKAYLISNPDQLYMFAKMVKGAAKAGEYKTVDSVSEEELSPVTCTTAYFTDDIDLGTQSLSLNAACTIDMKNYKLSGKIEEFGSGIIIVANSSESAIEINNGVIEGNCELGGTTSLLSVNSGKVIFTNCVFDYANQPYGISTAIRNLAGDLTMNDCSVKVMGNSALEMNGSCKTTLNNSQVSNTVDVTASGVLITVNKGDLIINGGTYESFSTVIYATGTNGDASLDLKNAKFSLWDMFTGSSGRVRNITAWVPLKMTDCEVRGGNIAIESTSDLTIAGNTNVTAVTTLIDANFEPLASIALYINRVATKDPKYNITGGRFTSLGKKPYGIYCETDPGVETITVNQLLGENVHYSVEVGDADETISGEVEVINEKVHSINYVIPYGVNSTLNPKSFTSDMENITLMPPTAKNGFKFVGWYLDSEYENKVTSLDTSVNTDYTLFAKFDADPFTIKLDANGGTGTAANINKTYAEANRGITIPCGFARAGYVFTGWSFDKNSEEPDFYGGYVYLGNITSYIEENSIADNTVTLYATWRSLNVDLSKTTVFFDDGVSSFEFVPGGVEPSTIMVCAQDADSLDYVVLTKGVDYDIVFENNKKIGTATAKIVPHEGNTSVTNEKKITFKITACPFSDKEGNPNIDISLTSGDTYTYTGSQIKPEVKIMMGETELVLGTDYTVSYSNNINAADSASAKAPTITVKGKGLYSGTAKKTFTISPQAIDAAVEGATFASIVTADSAVYTGKEIKPSVKLTYKVGEKVKNLPTSAYTVTYANNIAVSATEPTITVTGRGNYTGSLTKKFEIKGKSVTKLSVAAKSAKPAYTGADTKVTNPVTVKDGKTVLLEDVDYELHYTGDTTNVTKDGVKYYITGKGNYDPATKTSEKTYKILPIKFVVSQDNTYFKEDGETHKPTISIKDINGNALSSELFSFTSKATEFKEAGSYSITVKPSETTLNYTGSAVVKYTIGSKDSFEKATITVPEEESTKVYTGKAITVLPVIKIDDNTLVKDTDYTLSYKANVNAGTATITAKGKGKYTGTLTTTFTILPKDISSEAVITVSNDNAVYAAKALPAKIVVKLGKATLKAGKDYTLSYLDKDGNALESVPENAGAYFVKVTAINNYSSDASFKKAFNISKKNVSKLSYSLPKGTKYVTDSSLLTLTVKDGKKILTKDLDYAVSFGRITNGKVTATITAVEAGNYTGTINKTFNISAEANKITTSSNQVYVISSKGVDTGNIGELFNVESNCKDINYVLTGCAGNTNKENIEVDAAGNYTLVPYFVGTITVKISSGNGKDYKKATKTVKLIVIPDEAHISGVNVKNGKIDVAIAYENVIYETSYEIRYATNDKMTKAKTIKVKDLTKIGDDKIAATITGKVGTVYYLQIRRVITSNGKTYYSEWTDFNNGEPVVINR